MARMPPFLYSLPKEVPDGAMLTLSALYHYASDEAVDSYLLHGLVVPFARCSIHDLLNLFGGRRKRPTVYKDLGHLEEIGAISKAPGGYLLPLMGISQFPCQQETSQESPDGDKKCVSDERHKTSVSSNTGPPSLRTETTGVSEQRQNGLKHGAKSTFRDSSPLVKEVIGFEAEALEAKAQSALASRFNSETKRAAEHAGGDLSEMLARISLLREPVDEHGQHNPKARFDPGSPKARELLGKLVAHVMQAQHMSRDAAKDYIYGIMKRCARVCDRQPEKRKWWGHDALTCERRPGGKMSRWEMMVADAHAEGPSPEEIAARKRADEEAMRRAEERERDERQLEQLLRDIEHPPKPTAFHRGIVAWEKLPAYYRALLFAPQEAQEIGRRVIAEARTQGRKPTLLELRTALNAINVDPALALDEQEGGNRC